MPGAGNRARASSARVRPVPYRLVMFMLRNRAPDRFTGGKAKALNATDKDTLARLKKQWREEWAAEFHTAHATDSRAAYRAFRALEDARDIDWLRGDHGEAAMAAAEAEYEEWFGPGRDRRAHIDKLVDMRTWPRGGEDEGVDEGVDYEDDEAEFNPKAVAIPFPLRGAPTAQLVEIIEPPPFREAEAATLYQQISARIEQVGLHSNDRSAIQAPSGSRQWR